MSGSAGRSLAAALAVAGVMGPPAGAQPIDVWSRPKQLERAREWDVLHYRVALDLDLAGKRFEGLARITLTPLRDGLEHCELDAEELVVTGVGEGAGRPLRFEQSDRSVRIVLSRTAARGDTLRLEIAYHAIDPHGGFFFDEAGDGHPRMVSTDSWPDEAHHWFPCWDHPADKATQEMLLTVPKGNRALSNGRLVGVAEDAGRGTLTWHWSLEHPHATYLAMLAAGPFEVIADSLDTLPLAAWVYPGTVEEARPLFGRTPEMIAFYEETFGVPFPWAKYDQVATPHVGGGAEATSATILGDAVLRASADPARRLTWERIIAHEAAHQWWGDLVTMRDWTHTWLSESFATYSDYLWTRHDRGEEAGALDLEGKREQYLREARERYRRPIVFDRWVRPEENFDAHTYPKGAAVLHMLRAEVGDETFFHILNRYLCSFAYTSVVTEDFIAVVREVAGRDLGWFFDQWLYRPGHPVLEVGYDWIEAEGTLRLRVTQVQDTTHGVPGAYRLPVAVGITTASGKRVERIVVSERVQTFTFPCTQPPLLVRFDEGNVLLMELDFPKSETELRYQVEHDDVIGRRRAAARLHSGGIGSGRVRTP
jgi:aminopeptidase N